ncbi:hypothetical protein F2P79_025498 [Pimephales promelas]|nr:hypothetical protein F2P79_025498 [Pimephales promelas]
MGGELGSNYQSQYRLPIGWSNLKDRQHGRAAGVLAASVSRLASSVWDWVSCDVLFLDGREQRLAGPVLLRGTFFCQAFEMEDELRRLRAQVEQLQLEN